MADALKKATTENKALTNENQSFRIELEWAKKEAAALTDYYNVSEEKTKALQA